MPRPGTEIDVVDAAPFGGAVLDSGQAFFVGVTERGDVDTVGSLQEYARAFGERSGGSLMYDSAGAFFAEGGATLHVSRSTGAASVGASIAFGSATLHASSSGAWGNDVKVDAVAPSTRAERVLATRATGRAAGDPVLVTVSYDGQVVERSGVLASIDELVAWAEEHSAYVRVTKGADNVLPAAGTSATLAGGVDDASVAAADLEAALARLPYELGPGQVAAPGLTSTATHEALLAHADRCRRNALLDLPDSVTRRCWRRPSPRSDGHDRRALRRRVRAVGDLPVAQTSPATVEVPYSGIEAGLIARSDAATATPTCPRRAPTGSAAWRSV
jgi:hypothetical protein